MQNNREPYVGQGRHSLRKLDWFPTEIFVEQLFNGSVWVDARTQDEWQALKAAYQRNPQDLATRQAIGEPLKSLVA